MNARAAGTMSRAWRVGIAGCLVGAFLSAMPGLAAAADLPGMEAPMPATVQSNCGRQGSTARVSLAMAVRAALEGEPHLLIARQDVAVAKADAKSASAAFLPNIQFVADEERYVPHNGASPVVVIGNNVIGGPQVKSAYGSFSLNWNLMHSGQDLAAYHGAKAGVRAAAHALDSQVDDSLEAVIRAYERLYEAQVKALDSQQALALSRDIELRARDRYRHGHGTTIAIGQAAASTLTAQEKMNRACRMVTEKSSALALAMGMEIRADQQVLVDSAPPAPQVPLSGVASVESIVDNAPGVLAAREKVNEARESLKEAHRAFGPSLDLSIRRDYLGQSVRSLSVATNHVGPSDYRYDLSLEQPIFSLRNKMAHVDKARANWLRAQAVYREARLVAQQQWLDARGAQREASASLVDAMRNRDEADQVLSLTQSLFRAGHTDRDAVDQAQIARDQAQTEMRVMAAKRARAQWAAARASDPNGFPYLLLRELHLRIRNVDSDGGG